MYKARWKDKRDERVSGEMKGGNTEPDDWMNSIQRERERESPPYSHERVFLLPPARLFVFDQNSITLNVHGGWRRNRRAILPPPDDVPRKNATRNFTRYSPLYPIVDGEIVRGLVFVVIEPALPYFCASQYCF